MESKAVFFFFSWLMCIQVISQLIYYARTTLSKHPELTFQEVLQGGPVVILLDANPKCHILNYKRRVSYVN